MKKKLCLKVLSFVIAVLLLFNAMPIPVFGTVELQIGNVDETVEISSENETSPAFKEGDLDAKHENYTLDKMPNSVKERIDLSKAERLDTSDAADSNSVTVVNTDGTRILTVFSEPIKYVDEESEKVEFIDNSLTVPENGNNAFECVTNDKKSYFPKNINKGIYLTNDKYSVTMIPVSAELKKNGKIKYSKIKIKKKDYAEYDGVFGEKTSLQYAPTNTGVKENIILEEYTGTNKFSYIIDSKKLVPSSLEGRSITFIDPETEEPVFKIKETFIYDSRYNSDQRDTECVSYNNYYTLEEQKNGKYILTSVVDDEFLRSEDTVYPVTIDPYTDWINSGTDGTICDSIHEMEDFEDLENHLNLGYRYDTNWRIWVKFDELKRMRMLNPKLVLRAMVSINIDIVPPSPAPIYLGVSTANKSISYNPDREECFISWLDQIGSGTLTSMNNEIEITNTFLKWLENDATAVSQPFYPGFIMYLDEDYKEEFFLLDTENLPAISVYYISDQTLKDDVYYIKNLKHYMCVGEDDEVYFTKNQSVAEAEGLWQVEVDQVMGFYTITNCASGLRLHQTDTDEIITQIELEIPNQEWRLVENDDATRRMICRYPYSAHSIKSLTVSSSYDSCEAEDYEFSEYQNWIFEPFQPSEPLANMVEKTKSQWPTANAKNGNKNLLYGRLPIYMEYKTNCTFASSGSGVPGAYIGNEKNDGREMTDGSIENYNIDLRGYTLKHYYERDYIRFVNRNSLKYRPKGELYLDMTFDLGSEKSFNSIWFATSTDNNNYAIGAFEIYASNDLESLYFTRNKVADFDHCDSTWSGVLNINYLLDQKGRYFGIRITQGVLNGDWTSSAINHAYARIRDIALFDSSSVTGIELPEKSKTVQLGSSFSSGATVFPSKAANKSIVVTSSNPTVASVNSSTNQITANAVGNAVITVTTVDGGFLDTCNLTVANYCGGSNYKDVTEHSLELEDDGYYVCSYCDYRIQSPELQDVNILSYEDYRNMICLMIFYSQCEVYELRGPEPSGTYIPLLKSIQNEMHAIRNKTEYKYSYQYVNSQGSYHYVEATNVPSIEINEITVTASNIGAYNGLFEAISSNVSVVENSRLGTIMDFESLIQEEMNVLEFCAFVADLVGAKATAKYLSTVNNIKKIIKSEVEVGDKVISITTNLESSDFLSFECVSADIILDKNDIVKELHIKY